MPDGAFVIVILGVLVALGGFLFRLAVAQDMARRAGLNEEDAITTAIFNDPSISATYVASSMQGGRAAAPAPKPAEQRLAELRRLLDNGLISQAEYDARRTKILDSI